MSGGFASGVALFAALAMLSGVAPRWPLSVAAVAVALAAIARLAQPGSTDPALLALLGVALATPILLRQWQFPPGRSAGGPLVKVAIGLAVFVPSLLTVPASAVPIATVLTGLALLGSDPRRGTLTMAAAVVAAAVAGGASPSLWVAAGLGVCVLATWRWPWVPPLPLGGLLVAALGLALEPARAGAPLLLAGAWLAAGLWPLGQWTRGVAGWRFGGVVLAVVPAVALFLALPGAMEWQAGATLLMAAGALGVGVSGGAALAARTPLRRLAADAAVQTALAACALAIGGTAGLYGAMHLLIRAPLLALGTRAPPHHTGGALRWARAGLPVFGTFWTTFTIVARAGTVQPWLLVPLLPGLLAHVAATWRAPDGDRAVPAWIAWLAMAPAAITGIVWTAGWMPDLIGRLP